MSGEHSSQGDPHVQRPWGSKELGVAEDLKDSLVGAVGKWVGDLRRLESGWQPAIHCQATVSWSHSDTDVNGQTSVSGITRCVKASIS